MTPRRVLFWIHLTVGCVAGLVILVMSVTGVLLACKRQIVNWADRGFRSHSAPQPQHLPVDDLLAKLQAIQGQRPSGITFRSDPGAPVAFDFGRERTLFLDCYTGQVLGDESPKLRAFFSEVEELHRWLGVRADSRATGRAITGACNLSFLILVVTGPILWWPKEWTWRNLKKITVLRGGPLGARTRLELAQRSGILVRSAALPDRTHRRDHVLRLGEQSSLPHDGEYATAARPRRRSKSSR